MIDFLRYRFLSLAASGLFIAAGVAGYVYNGGFRYSVDFTGGTQVQFKFGQEVGSEQIKNSLSVNGWEDPVVLEFGPKEVAVRVKGFSSDAQGVAQKMQQVLEKDLKSSVEIQEVNSVGPGVGEALRWNAILAVLLGLVLMLIYIAARFLSVSFGVGAVFALLHDALMILALFALLRKEISPNVICAILATLGYSINDTIVIFARIRENFAKMHGSSPEEIVNTSLNQTLRRTTLTSLSTALVVGSIFVFGGETLHTLSLALLVGIVVGTYSSIYIASPVMLFLRRS